MTDKVLAIAQKTSVDIRDATSGKRLVKLPVTDTPRVIVISRDDVYLAVGMDNGDVIVYHRGLQEDYSGSNIRIRRTVNSPVSSIIFSKDSTLMATCAKDNTIRAYKVGNLSIGCFQKYVEPLGYGKCRGDASYPHKCFKAADIADIDLYLPLNLKLISVFVVHTHYSLCRKIRWHTRRLLNKLHRPAKTSSWCSARIN